MTAEEEGKESRAERKSWEKSKLKGKNSQESESMRQTEAERIPGPSCSSHPQCCLPWDGFYILWQQQPGQCKEMASSQAKPTERGNTESSPAAALPVLGSRRTDVGAHVPSSGLQASTTKHFSAPGRAGLDCS